MSTRSLLAIDIRLWIDRDPALDQHSLFEPNMWIVLDNNAPLDVAEGASAEISPQIDNCSQTWVVGAIWSQLGKSLLPKKPFVGSSPGLDDTIF